MSAKEIERKPERIPNQHEYTPKKKETNDSKNKELLMKVVCYGFKIIKIKRRQLHKFTRQERMSQKRVNHMEVYNTAWKEKKWDLRTNPKKRKKYVCICTEQRNSKKTLKK